MLRLIGYACFLLGTMASLAPFSQAGIVLTPVVSSIGGNGAVSINLYATFDGNDDAGLGANSNEVGAYGFSVSVTEPVAGLAATQIAFNGDLSSWGGIPNGPSSIVGQTYTFSGAITAPPFPAPIVSSSIATTQSASTLIGTLSFTAPSPGSYNITTAAAANSSYFGTGFLRVTANTAGGQTQLTGVFNPLTVNITAVPEPSTFLLCGLAGAGSWFWQRRRKKSAKTA